MALPATAATVSLELVTERGVQITAPQAWLQLLGEMEIRNVRIRGARPGDKPQLETLDNRGKPIYQVTGVLTSRDEIALPGGRFGKRDRAKLRDYFDRLRADGAEGVTAELGKFDLTKRQFELVFKDLSQPTGFTTKDLPTVELMAQARRQLQLQLAFDPSTERALAKLKPLQVELSSLTLGTTLAITLRNAGLAILPEKPRGETVRYRVSPIDWTKGRDKKETWPIGYKPDARPSEVSPIIMQSINVEIDGFTLAEAIGAIGPRLKMPIVWDEATLAKHRINPTNIPVKLPPAKMYYKRILDKLLFQARLKGKLRVDEAGTAFYWITK